MRIESGRSVRPGGLCAGRLRGALIGTLIGALSGALAGCDGGGGAEKPAEAPAASSSVPAAVVAGSWQARMAVAQNRAPFEGRDAWIRYFKGERSGALAAFASEKDGPAAARLHGEYAALYRQAALVAAWATIHTWDTDAQPSDPAAMPALVGIAGALARAPQAERLKAERLKALPADLPADVRAEAEAWAAWAAGGAADAASWPLGGVPKMELPAPEVGKLPDIGWLPHWRLPYRGEAGEQAVAHPAALLALARYHEAAAALADPGGAAALALLLDPWRLPGEPRAGAGAGDGAGVPPVADAYLFMSPYLTAADVAFAAAVSGAVSAAGATGAAEGAGSAALASAVERFKAESAFAAILARCRASGTTDVECVQSQAGLLAKAIEAEMDRAAGSAQDFHRPFAEYARVGALRVAALAAAAAGEREPTGLLRIAALDRSMGNTRDPVFVSSMSAWDASNRNSMRCADLLHELVPNAPGLEAARLPVDALQIRIGRNSAPAGAM